MSQLHDAYVLFLFFCSEIFINLKQNAYNDLNVLNCGIKIHLDFWRSINCKKQLKELYFWK